MWFAIGFAAVSCVCAYFYTDNLMWFAVAAAAAAMILAIGYAWFRWLRIPVMVFVAFTLGITWFSLYDLIYLSGARSLDAQVITIQVEATDYSYETAYGSAVSGVLKQGNKQYQILLYLDGKVSVEPGDQISGLFRLRFTAEGGSREPTYHRSEGIFLLGYQKDDISITKAEKISWKYRPAVWRRNLTNKIDTLFPEDAAAFAKALLLGDRSDIDYETSTAFKVSGISHIVAVSGLHVSILFGLVYLVTGRNRFLAAGLGIPVLILFAAIAGFTPSITRACIMQCLMLLAMLVKREYDPPTALAAAVLLMVVINPMSVISISLQLSVGCMIGIFLFSQRIHDWFLTPGRLGSAKGKGILPRLKRWFVNSISFSLGASVMTTPLVAVYFETVSLVSIFTNLLVVWMISYIFYGIMLTMLISLFSFYLSKVTAMLVTFPIRLVTGTAKLLSSFPLAAVYTQSIYIVIWLISAYIMLAAFLCMKKKPTILLIGCTTLTLCLALLASWSEPRLDECRVTVLDVGQGQCILLQSEGCTFLVDCGGDSDTGSADLAAETLLSQGVWKLDGVIVTHYDTDHTRGIPYLLTRVNADYVFLPDLLDEKILADDIKEAADGEIVCVSENKVLTFGNAKITLFAPEVNNLDNECSMCVLFQTENYDILITGDRGKLGEKLLLLRTELPELEVLVAGHHGSAGSTNDFLLEATKPKYVLISAGENNIYGHPAAALLERLRKAGCIVYRTDQNGTIIFRG